MRKKCILFLFCSLALFRLSAQDSDIDFKQEFRYNIVKTDQQINLDGNLDEAIWSEVEIEGNFWQKVPYFEAGADPKTEIRLCYDENNLYVAAKCFQKEEVIIQSLKRDEYWNNDGIAIILDPLNTRTNSILFGTSAVGVQWDALRSETNDINSDWSNKWNVKTQITDEYWSAEFAIPFRILRYSENIDEWGMNFVRNIMYCNEYHNWTAVPESFWPPNSAFAGALSWDKPPSKKSGNFNLIPYIKTGLVKEKGEDTKVDFDAGMDARLSLSSTLNLDLTFFPDFSQIEADELVTNLTRFNISLPEKRTFFLENADLFAGFGTGGSRPFFSRRIGLDEDLKSVPILYGARLTGNINPSTRIGMMNIHSKTTDESLGQNQSAVALKKQFGRSFIQGMFLNRQAFDGAESLKNNYGRNASLESFYGSDNGQVNGWLGLHQSIKEGYNKNQGFYNGGFLFKNPSWEFLNDIVIMQENYFADMGFLARVDNYDAERDTSIRVGLNASFNSVNYFIRPKGEKIARHTIGFENLSVRNPDWTFNEQNNQLRYFLTLRNSQEFNLRLNYNHINLLFPFSFTDDAPLPAEKYKSGNINFEFKSDKRKKLSYSITAQTGGFYNGTLNQIEANANYRIQPWGNFSLGYQWNNLDFPDPYGKAKITALVSKIEIGFSENILWTSLFQFVDQSDFMGINSRLQWRFAPMSDLFLVYVDNYDVLGNTNGNNPFNSNNRALILKVNYWY